MKMLFISIRHIFHVTLGAVSPTNCATQTPAAKKRILVKQIWRTQKIKNIERTPMTMAEHHVNFLENDTIAKII
jgi:hypothetical protein